jgi:putative copper resistance protein D
MNLYDLNVTVHVLAAFLWLGGMLFLAAVGAPVLREIESPELRSRLFKRIGERFRWVGWICIVILLVTGVGNLHFRNLLRWEVLGDAGFWGTRYGTTLAWKLASVFVMLAIQAVHDFVHGPRASRATPESPDFATLRHRAAWMARVNAVVGIFLIFMAVKLARGG